jgi:hypothetical protein
MPLSAVYRSRSVYHFTPIANLPAILEHGLLAISEQKRLGLPLHTIVWEAIQAHRASLAVPVGAGGFVEDYVPLYFCKLSPMLLTVISNKIVDEETIIHFEFPIDTLERYPSVFTDAATMPDAQPRFFTDSKDLRQLNWEAIDSPAWRMPNPALRQARLAELLIHRQMPITTASRIIVWDNAAAGKAAAIFAALHLSPPCIETDPGCYFIDPRAAQPTPAVHGPQSIAHSYQNTVERLRFRLGSGAAPRFSNLNALRLALRSDLSCLPETAELVGLLSDNRVHFEDVGSHTRRVVSELLKTSEYQGLPAPGQDLLELAAFLHDIGKGPKSRWANTGGKQQLDFDHPVKALPMLERILTEEVAQVSLPDAALICKLVAYHDIVGGVLTSGRRLAELQSVIARPAELDMLMALSRADASAINPAWVDLAQRNALRQAALQDM